MKKIIAALFVVLAASNVSGGDFFAVSESTVQINVPVVVNSTVTAGRFLAPGGNSNPFIAYGHRDYSNVGIRFHDPEFRSIVFVVNGADQFKVGPNLVEMLGTSVFIAYKANPGVPTFTWAGDLATGYYNYGLYVGGATPKGQVSFMADGVEVTRTGKTSQKFFTPVLVGTTTESAGIVIRSSGTIESMSGGFKFPDGTTQTTAFVGSSACTDHGPLSSAPASPTECARYFNTVTKQFYGWNGSSWVILG